MKNDVFSSKQTRRDFIKKLTISVPAVYLGVGGIFSMAKAKNTNPLTSTDFEYKYKTVSVKHVEELKKWFDKLKKENKIGTNKTFRGYIEGFKFNPEEILQGAKSIIVISIPQKVSSIVFNHKGKKIEILIPTGYVDDGLKMEDAKKRIMKDIVKDSGKKLQEGVRLPIKTVAIRSGLADFGLNNISFVDEYGSFHMLLGFYTDKELPDNWRPLNMLRLCKGCTICKDRCPTKCIRDDNFVINIDKCVTLYNEVTDPMPDWVPAETHNALVGCMKCQDTCPANASRIKDIDKLAEITEKETEFLLSDKKDDKLHKQIAKKLVRFPSVNNLDYFRRNFKLVFKNARIV